MPIIIITIIITFLVLISWAYHSLGNIEITKKVMWIIGLLFIVYIATNITFAISKGEIQYPNDEIMSYVKNILVFIFTGINGLFVIPFFCRGLDGLDQENISKEQALHRGILCIIILLVLLMLECGYMASTQEGILKIINHKS